MEARQQGRAVALLRPVERYLGAWLMHVGHRARSAPARRRALAALACHPVASRTKSLTASTSREYSLLRQTRPPRVGPARTASTSLSRSVEGTHRLEA